MSEKLKLCPFCGGEAKFRYRMPYSWVECKKCGASTLPLQDYYEQQEFKDKAIETWNKRIE